MKNLFQLQGGSAVAAKLLVLVVLTLAVFDTHGQRRRRSTAKTAVDTVQDRSNTAATDAVSAESIASLKTAADEAKALVTKLEKQFATINDPDLFDQDLIDAAKAKLDAAKTAANQADSLYNQAVKAKETADKAAENTRLAEERRRAEQDSIANLPVQTKSTGLTLGVKSLPTRKYDRLRSIDIFINGGSVTNHTKYQLYGGGANIAFEITLKKVTKNTKKAVTVGAFTGTNYVKEQDLYTHGGIYGLYYPNINAKGLVGFGGGGGIDSEGEPFAMAVVRLSAGRISVISVSRGGIDSTMGSDIFATYGLSEKVSVGIGYKSFRSGTGYRDVTTVMTQAVDQNGNPLFNDDGSRVELAQRVVSKDATENQSMWVVNIKFNLFGNTLRGY